MIAERGARAGDTDQELMARVSGGDHRAFEALYWRYHGQAYALARRVTGRSGGAEEVTQDAFLTLWREAAKFDVERASLRTWLLTIVRHRGIDSLRRAGSRPVTQAFAEGAAERLEAPERTEDDVLATLELDRARGLMSALPPEQREVIDLAYLAGYTQAEIAAKVGVSLGTVKGRARLGLHKLRRAAEYGSAHAPAA